MVNLAGKKARLMELKDQIRSVVEKHIPSIKSDFKRLEEATSEPVQIEEAFQAAHKLKGASGSIGFSEISMIAHKIEDVLSSFNNESIDKFPAEMSQDLAQLRALVSEITPEKSKLIAKYNV